MEQSATLPRPVASRRPSKPQSLQLPLLSALQLHLRKVARLYRCWSDPCRCRLEPLHAFRRTVGMPQPGAKLRPFEASSIRRRRNTWRLLQARQVASRAPSRPLVQLADLDPVSLRRSRAQCPFTATLLIRQLPWSPPLLCAQDRGVSMDLLNVSQDSPLRIALSLLLLFRQSNQRQASDGSLSLRKLRPHQSLALSQEARPRQNRRWSLLMERHQLNVRARTAARWPHVRVLLVLPQPDQDWRMRKRACRIVWREKPRGGFSRLRWAWRHRLTTIAACDEDDHNDQQRLQHQARLPTRFRAAPQMLSV